MTERNARRDRRDPPPENGTYVASSSAPMDQARIILALEITARRVSLLVVRVQVLEIEDRTVLRLAIGSVELGGVIVVMTRLAQPQRRLVQLVAESVTEPMTVTGVSM